MINSTGSCHPAPPVNLASRGVSAAGQPQRHRRRPVHFMRRWLPRPTLGASSCLPVASVELGDWEGGKIEALEAACVYAPAIGVDSGAMERVNAAVSAEEVGGGTRIELVLR